MESRKLNSSDLQQLLEALTQTVARLIVRAKSQGYIPPLKLLITDADQDVVLDLGLTANGIVQDFTVDAPLQGRSPLAIVLTDQVGKVWTWKLRSCIQ